MTAVGGWVVLSGLWGYVGVHVLTGFDVQLGRPDALPAYTLDRALLRDVAVFP
jgi:hypothetical protein